MDVALVAPIDFARAALGALPPPPARRPSQATAVFIVGPGLHLVTMQLDAEGVADLGNLARCDHQPPLDTSLDDRKTVPRRKGRDEVEVGGVGTVLACKTLGRDIVSRARWVRRPVLLFRQF